MFSILPPLPYQNLKGTFLQISEKLPKNLESQSLKMTQTSGNNPSPLKNLKIIFFAFFEKNGSSFFFRSEPTN